MGNLCRVVPNILGREGGGGPWGSPWGGHSLLHFMNSCGLGVFTFWCPYFINGVCQLSTNKGMLGGCT